jgi:hypothetical protein
MVTSVSSSIRPDKIISLQDAHFSDGDPAAGSADGHGSMSAGWTVNIATLAGCRVAPSTTPSPRPRESCSASGIVTSE